MASAAQTPGMSLSERSLAPKLRLQRMRGLTEAGAHPAALPTEPNTVRGQGPWTLWLGPAEWLIYAVDGPLDVLTAIAGPLVSSDAYVTADITSGLALLELAGSGAVDVLAAGCGLDLEGGAVPLDHCAQSHFHHVPLILHRPAAADLWRLFVDRSVSRFLCDSLCSTYEVRNLRSR